MIIFAKLLAIKKIVIIAIAFLIGSRKEENGIRIRADPMPKVAEIIDARNARRMNKTFCIIKNIQRSSIPYKDIYSSPVLDIQGDYEISPDMCVTHIDVDKFGQYCNKSNKY